MHVVVGFFIVLAMVSGAYQQKETPKGEVTLTLPDLHPVKLREPVKPLSEIQSDRVVRQNYDYSCGSAALATLLRYQFGEDFTEKQVIHGLMRYGDSKRIAEHRAFSLLDMKRFVGQLGYRGAGYKAQMKDLEDLERSGIVPIKLLNYRHFAVLKGIHKGHVFLADPWRGNISFTLQEFRQRWYKNILFMVHPEGAPELSALRLKEEDLRFIDEDAALSVLFENAPADAFRADRMLEKVAEDRIIYDRK